MNYQDSDPDQKLLYTFRGWIGFVAFMDMGNAFRCYIENKSFLGDLSHPMYDDPQNDDPVLPRVLGMYSILKALVLIHCTLFIHYKPIVSLGICSIAITILLYVTEVLYFHSTTITFYVIFPCVLNGLTLFGLVFLPKRLLETQVLSEDENSELIRQPPIIKRRRAKKN